MFESVRVSHAELAFSSAFASVSSITKPFYVFPLGLELKMLGLPFGLLKYFLQDFEMFQFEIGHSGLRFNGYPQMTSRFLGIPFSCDPGPLVQQLRTFLCLRTPKQKK